MDASIEEIFGVGFDTDTVLHSAAGGVEGAGGDGAGAGAAAAVRHQHEAATSTSVGTGLGAFTGITAS